MSIGDFVFFTLGIFFSSLILGWITKEICRAKKWHYRVFCSFCLPVIILSALFPILISATVVVLGLMIFIVIIIAGFGLMISKNVGEIISVVKLPWYLFKSLSKLPVAAKTVFDSLRRESKKVITNIKQNPIVNGNNA